MSGCALLAQCIFFNDKMESMPKAAEMLKNRYCRKDFSRCARYVVRSKLGPDKVPADLSPSQMDRAQELISK